ncbi:MAG TPA: MBL fold metallo-hydrolase [Kineosporiaceae bacterium]|nr:MBL fold metallo-hydrolase [Kineosporiaceae bacterium]
MRLTVVGCAGSYPSPDSPASCYLVEADDDQGRTWRVVLDLGSGAVGPLQRYAPLDELDAVLLSHLHPDHYMDVCGLYVARRYAPGGPVPVRLPLYGPRGTGDRIRQAYGGEGSGLDATFEVHDLADAEPVELGPLTVTPYRVQHPVEAYGLRVEHHAGPRTAVLAYTGDTDSCDALLPLAKGADLLLAESSFQEGRDTTRGVHLTGLRAGQAAADAGCRRLVLTHLPAWTDPDVVRAEARSVFPGAVETARPGAAYVL